MRRALLVLAFAAPLAAAARIDVAPDGAVVDLGNYSVKYTTSYVNDAQCAGEAPLDLQWDIVPMNGGLVGSGTYEIYASSAQSSSIDGADANLCPEENEQNANPEITAGIVTSTQYDADIQRLEVPGPNVIAAAGRACTEGLTLYVCAHLKESGTIKGRARGKFMVQLAAPSAPTGVVAGPAGVDSLHVSWTASTGVEVSHYVAVATPVGGGGEFRSGDALAGTDEVTISGLPVTDPPTSFDVVVYAYSLGGNPSPPSASVVGTPEEVFDFWEWYRQAPGAVEEGGCGAGGAGPLGLLAVAVLAVLRRRK